MLRVLLLIGKSTSQGDVPPVGSEYNDRNDDGSYRYGFQTGDAGSHYQSVLANKANQVVGRFGSRDPAKGRVIETRFTAGQRGFRAEGPNIARKMSLSQAKIPYNPPVDPNSPGYNPTYDSYHDPNEDPSYRFDFRTPTYSRQEISDARGHVDGQYYFFDDVGERHNVAYEAGAQIGFNVKTPFPDSKGFAGLFYRGPPSKQGGNPRGVTSIQRGNDGSYRFVAAGPDQRRTEISDSRGNVRGSYTYVDDKGQQRTVEYIAGPNIGYRVLKKGIGPNLPPAPPFLPPPPPFANIPEELPPVFPSTTIPPVPTGPVFGVGDSFGDIFDGDFDKSKPGGRPVITTTTTTTTTTTPAPGVNGIFGGNGQTDGTAELDIWNEPSPQFGGERPGTTGSWGDGGGGGSSPWNNGGIGGAVGGGRPGVSRPGSWEQGAISTTTTTIRPPTTFPSTTFRPPPSSFPPNDGPFSSFTTSTTTFPPTFPSFPTSYPSSYPSTTSTPPTFPSSTTTERPFNGYPNDRPSKPFPLPNNCCGPSSPRPDFGSDSPQSAFPEDDPSGRPLPDLENDFLTKPFSSFEPKYYQGYNYYRPFTTQRPPSNGERSDSTFLGSNKNYMAFPSGVAVRAHIQSLDILPYGSRLPPPGIAIESVISRT